MKRIPATIVTGFLGAGKTSLIRHVIAHPDAQRIALIINEFGDLGVDREMVLGCGEEGCADEDVIELTNGCICCTVADDFLPTIRTLLARPEPPDHIMIETSGLALPKPLVKAFAWPEVKSRVTVDGVVAVIDSPAVASGQFAADPAAVDAARRADPALEHENPLEEVFTDQLLCADMIVLNKLDLMPHGLSPVEAFVRAQARPGTPIVPASCGRVDPLVLIGLGAGAEDDLNGRPSRHDDTEDHDHDDFASVSVRFGVVPDTESFHANLAELAAAHNLLRVKGFVAVDGRPMRHVVQGVGRRIQGYYDRPWKAGEARASQLVLIGRQGLSSEAIALAIAAIPACTF